MTRVIKKSIPLFIILTVVVLFYALGLHKQFSLEMLKAHHTQLQIFTAQHFWLSSLILVAIYAVVTAFTLPLAALLSITSGYLFGVAWGSLLVVVGATCGATSLFLIVRYALSEWVQKRSAKWVHQLKAGFNENAFNYLLTLRLIPVIPFAILNSVPALLDMRATQFILATALGIVPGTVVYNWLGNGLRNTIAIRESINLSIIFEPQILIPLILLACLALVPVVYKKLKRS